LSVKLSGQDLKHKLTSQIDASEANLQKLKSEIIKYEQSLNKDQQNFNQLIEQLGKIENEKNLALQRLQGGEDRLSEIKSQTAHLKNSISTVEQKLKKAKISSENLKEKLDLEDAKYQKSDNHFLVQSETYNTLREQEQELKSAIGAQRIKRERLALEIEALSTQDKLLEQDILMQNGRIKKLQQQKAKEDKELTKSQKLVDQIEEKVRGAESNVEELEAKAISSQDSITEQLAAKHKKEAELGGLQQRIRFLENIIENNEGLPEALKYVLQDKKQKTQVLSEIIEINEEHYTKIVELYLDPWLHHLIVEKRSEAIKLYEIVRDAQKGKLQAFILEELATNTLTKSDNKDLLPLSGIISVDAKYQNLINQITSDVFISKVSYKYLEIDERDRQKVILFPDEYLVLSQGKLYGGSSNLFEGVQLGRKKLVDKLGSQKESLLHLIEQEEQHCQSQKEELQSIQEQLKSARQSLVKERSDSDTQKASHYQRESSLINQASNIADLVTQIEQKEQEQKEVKASLEIKKQSYEELEEVASDNLSDQELTRQIQEVHNAYIAASRKRDQDQAALFEVRSTYNLALKDVEFFQNSISDSSDRLASLKEESASQVEVISTAKTQVTDSKKKLEDQYVLKSSLQEKLSANEDDYYKEKGKIFELEKSLSEDRSKLYTKDQLISQLNEKASNISFEIKGIHERNAIEFNIEIVETEFPVEYEDADLGELQARKSKIQDRIRSYGEINPMAITAYNEIKERHGQISTERDDILHAKASLEETIAEIEKTATERFNEALDQIRTNFKNVFQALFSDDDDCDIVLLESDDPLEAKALYLLKPAPFCIFDEVDAPLDDVNVLKFNKIIRNFSRDSQFIIITHNKLTMSEVDILYGVYLKELGVSGVSAVDFRTYDQTEMSVAE